jgi:hypothetical protein
MNIKEQLKNIKYNRLSEEEKFFYDLISLDYKEEIDKNGQLFDSSCDSYLFYSYCDELTLIKKKHSYSSYVSFSNKIIDKYNSLFNKNVYIYNKDKDEFIDKFKYYCKSFNVTIYDNYKIYLY